MSRYFTNYTTGEHLDTECINFHTHTTISNKYTLEGAYNELMRQLDMGDITDIHYQLDNNDIFFTADNTRYALDVKSIERADYYQITFSLYRKLN
jgi:hypothetical protein